MVDNNQGDKIPKKYYTIGEVAGELAVNQSLIRYWEKHFPKIKPKKNRKGHRLFTSQDIETLKFIQFLVKEKGHTIENAKVVLKNQNKMANKEYEMAKTLKQTRAFLLDIKKYLDESG